MKRFGFFYKSIILLVCLLLFAVTTPAFGGEAEAPGTGFALVMDDGGGGALTSPSIDGAVDYGHGFKYVAALDSAGYISSAVYKAPFIVQHRNGIVSAQNGKFKPRSPDRRFLSMGTIGEKQIIFAYHSDGLSPGPLITV